MYIDLNFNRPDHKEASPVGKDQSSDKENPLNLCSVADDDFYPSIYLDDVRKILRVDEFISDERLSFFLRDSIIAVNSELKSLKEKMIRECIDADDDFNFLYSKAVMFRAASRIYHFFRDFTLTGKGSHSSYDYDRQADHLLRMSFDCLAQLKGQTSFTAVLI